MPGVVAAPPSKPPEGRPYLCRKCGVAFLVPTKSLTIDFNLSIMAAECPNCLVVNIYLQPDGRAIHLWPREIPPEAKSDEHVPAAIADYFAQAVRVLPLSPMASAAISRRLLQTIMRENLGIT